VAERRLDEPVESIITLISNQDEMICTDPVYHARSGSDSLTNIVPSHIVAQPRPGPGFGKICYIALKSGHRPVVVASQNDGSIRLGGAYVDFIAAELELASFPHPDEALVIAGD
jgi:hypothetical protein